MASNLFTIGTSGIRAARAALDVTAQNIANAGSEGYVRRSLRLSEIAPSGGVNRVGDLTLSGVRIDGVARNADLFRQAEVRRTGSDLARADAELGGLENVEAALEHAHLYPAVTAFETSLQRLAADPVNGPLRAAVIEDGRTLARSFNLASDALATVGEGLRFEAADGTNQVNLLAGELARVNLQLARSVPGTSDQAALLDKRDALLGGLAEQTGVSASFAADNTVTVRIGGAGGPTLVQGGAANPFAMTSAADGTISFTLSGNPVSFGSGKLAGQAQALVSQRDTLTALDTLAATLASTANAAQAGGVALDGSAGQPFFSGTTAATLDLALTDGAGIATAPAGAGAGSRDPANLDALRAALSSAGVVDGADSLLFTASAAVAGRRVTAEALDTIASAARISLAEQAGVDLDQEAVNLVRYQQAFQASGKAIQVATECFDSLLAMG